MTYNIMRPFAFHPDQSLIPQQNPPTNTWLVFFPIPPPGGKVSANISFAIFSSVRCSSSPGPNQHGIPNRIHRVRHNGIERRRQPPPQSPPGVPYQHINVKSPTLLCAVVPDISRLPSPNTSTSHHTQHQARPEIDIPSTALVTSTAPPLDISSPHARI